VSRYTADDEEEEEFIFDRKTTEKQQ